METTALILCYVMSGAKGSCTPNQRMKRGIGRGVLKMGHFLFALIRQCLVGSSSFAKLYKERSVIVLNIDLGTDVESCHPVLKIHLQQLRPIGCVGSVFTL